MGATTIGCHERRCQPNAGKSVWNLVAARVTAVSSGAMSQRGCDGRREASRAGDPSRTHSLEVGSRQYSHKPPIPNGLPSFMAMAYGCLALWPLMAFHSKKPSTGRMHRRLR